jgi:hypothetical protein
VRWANDLHSESDKTDDILYLKESLQKLETTILPTTVDKWVSLHPSFGLVCWVDDDELKQQFKNSRDINFIQFGDLCFEDRQMLNGRVAYLMKSLGIQALSKVIDIFFFLVFTSIQFLVFSSCKRSSVYKVSVKLCKIKWKRETPTKFNLCFNFVKSILQGNLY